MRTPATPLAGRLVDARRNPAFLGVVLLLVVLATFVVLFSKDKINSALMSGETITVQFDQNYKLRPHVSQVKVAYVPVGKVVDVERRDDGGAEVTLKVEEDVLDVLGSEPSATIRPTTLLGGSYFVDLQPGGDPGAFTAMDIPSDRTEVPVELDRVAMALQPDARAGLAGFTASTDEFLGEGGREAVERLVRSTPESMRATGVVLGAAAGTRPEKDLGNLVSGMESTARALTSTQGQLDAIAVGLDDLTGVLGRTGDEFAGAVEQMPAALAQAESGLAAFNETLATLEDVAPDARPVAQELARVLEEVAPVVAEARPVVRDLRVVAADAEPLLRDLVPAVTTGTQVLDDLQGPVLDRINGPVTDWLYEDFDPQGEYDMTDSEKPNYQEIIYAFANLDRATNHMDQNGHAVAFQPGIGSGSVGGLPVSVEQLFKVATSWYYRDPETVVPPIDRRTTVPSLIDSFEGDR